ncbi:MAG: class I SAM-dependent methyltransferase [Chitinophagaceae bacterium]|nr:class I SAM-dependent methyltransferase [Chitinophagaceae bacterium]MCW5904050.1 class I SAM-dependent methyltransferase [Chitinophagaceae bacterium]
MSSCTLCSNNSFTTIGVVNGNDFKQYNLAKCSKCNHYFTDISSLTDTNILYDEGDYKIRDTQKSLFFKIQDAEYKKVLKEIQTLGFSNTSKLLDFGCGKGVFLHIAANNNFKNSIGIETSLPRANYAKEVYGLKVISEFYNGGNIDEDSFDVITMFHVLEHLPNPQTLLQELIQNNLKKGGILVLEVPNYGSWQSKIAGNKWLHLDIPRHLSHFTIEKIYTCVEKVELQIVKQQTFSLHLGIIGMAQSLLNIFGYKGFLIRELKEKKRNIQIATLAILPFAFLLELVASAFGKGGIIRVYAKK